MPLPDTSTGRLVGVLYACRACAAGNGYQDQHCRKCGASLRDAVPIRGAGDPGNEAGEAFHRSQVRQHRKQSLGMVLGWLCPVQALLAFCGMFPWYGILGHLLLAAVVIAGAARFRLGHLTTTILGVIGCLALWPLAPIKLAALFFLVIQAYLYGLAGNSLKATNDLTT